MWTSGFKYSWRKMEVAAQDRAGWNEVVCVRPGATRHKSVSKSVRNSEPDCWCQTTGQLNHYSHNTALLKKHQIGNFQKISINLLWLTDWRVFFLFLPSCLLAVTASIRFFMLPSRAEVFSALSFSRFSFSNRLLLCRRFFSRRSRSLSDEVRSVLPTNSRFCFVCSDKQCQTDLINTHKSHKITAAFENSQHNEWDGHRHVAETALQFTRDQLTSNSNNLNSWKTRWLGGRYFWNYTFSRY